MRPGVARTRRRVALKRRQMRPTQPMQKMLDENRHRHHWRRRIHRTRGTAAAGTAGRARQRAGRRPRRPRRHRPSQRPPAGCSRTRSTSRKSLRLSRPRPPAGCATSAQPWRLESSRWPGKGGIQSAGPWQRTWIQKKWSFDTTPCLKRMRMILGPSHCLTRA